MTASLILVLAGAIGIAVCLVFWIRNDRVYAYRVRVLGRIDELAKADIAAGRTDWLRWQDLFRQTSYDEMVVRFWRPLDSFYPPDLWP